MSESRRNDVSDGMCWHCTHFKGRETIKVLSLRTPTSLSRSGWSSCTGGLASTKLQTLPRKLK